MGHIPALAKSSFPLCMAVSFLLIIPHVSNSSPTPRLYFLHSELPGNKPGCSPGLDLPASCHLPKVIHLQAAVPWTAPKRRESDTRVAVELDALPVKAEISFNGRSQPYLLPDTCSLR